MYITAQRVRQIAGFQQGLNSFLYLHDHPIEGQDGRVDVKSLAAQPPDTLRFEILSVPPGGNSVLSYIDVACEDDTRFDNLRAALERFELYVPKELDDASYQYEETIQGVGIRLYLGAGIGLAPELEYFALRETVFHILALHRQDDSHESLQIELERNEQEWRFSPLPAEVELFGPPDSIHGVAAVIDVETLIIFEKMRGSIFPVIAESIFGMTSQELLEHGGVEIIDAHTRKILWRGP